MEPQNIQIKRFDFFELKDFANLNNGIAETFVETIAPEAIVIETPPTPPTFSEDELQQAKNIAYQQGFNEGKASAISAQQQIDSQNQIQISNNLEELILHIKQANEIIQNHIKNTETELANLALAAAHKIAGAAINTNALPLLQEIITNCLPHILHYPNLRIVLNEIDANEYWQPINTQIENTEYKGQVQIIPSNNLQRGDIKIEWQFGTLERSMQAINEQLIGLSPQLDLTKTITSQSQNPNKSSTRAALAARAAKLTQVKEQ